MMTFLILLMLALGSFAALLVLGISIVEAPWPLLLGILVIGLVLIQWLSVQGQANASAPPDKKALDSLKHNPASKFNSKVEFKDDSNTESVTDQDLVYRGIHYKEHSPGYIQDSNDKSSVPYSPKQQDEVHTIHGVYRGQKWQKDDSEYPAQTSPISNITYRGQKMSGDRSSQ